MQATTRSEQSAKSQEEHTLHGTDTWEREERELDDEVQDEDANLEQAEDEELPSDPTYENVAIYACLCIFSILGALARIGLQSLGTYSGQSVFPVVAAQAVGCALMGLFVRNRREIEAIYVPLYIGLGTGLCGSITTFSSWMFGVFAAFGNLNGRHTGGIRNVVDALTQIYITLAVATAGLRFGIHTSTFLRYGFPVGADRQIAEKQTDKKIQNILHLVVILLAFGMWLGTALLVIFKAQTRHITFSLLFAPPGAFIRYFLAQNLNTRLASFPLGTFSANILATAFDALFYLLKYTGSRSTLSCAVLTGGLDGFCGCFSTVSTFATELRGMKRYHAYRYAVVSILAGQAILVLTFGAYWWSRGLGAICNDRY